MSAPAKHSGVMKFVTCRVAEPAPRVSTSTAPAAHVGGLEAPGRAGAREGDLATSRAREPYLRRRSEGRPSRTDPREHARPSCEVESRALDLDGQPRAAQRQHGELVTVGRERSRHAGRERTTRRPQNDHEADSGVTTAASPSLVAPPPAGAARLPAGQTPSFPRDECTYLLPFAAIVRRCRRLSHRTPASGTAAPPPSRPSAPRGENAAPSEEGESRRRARSGSVYSGSDGWARSTRHRSASCLLTSRNAKDGRGSSSPPMSFQHGQRRARLLGYERSTTTWQEVIDDPEVDAVSIAAPNNLHREMALAAAAAGKHFRGEKPLGRFPAETAEIAGAVERAGIRTIVGLNYRHAPAVQHVKALLERGALGRIDHFRMQFLASYSANPRGALSWRFSDELAGLGRARRPRLACGRSRPAPSRPDPAGVGHLLDPDLRAPEGGRRNGDSLQRGEPTTPSSARSRTRIGRPCSWSSSLEYAARSS